MGMAKEEEVFRSHPHSDTLTLGKTISFRFIKIDIIDVFALDFKFNLYLLI